MNILIIIPKLSNGGIEKIASNFSLNLPKKYNQVIFSIMEQQESYSYAVEPIILRKELGKGLIGKFFVFLHRLSFFRRIIKENNIDVCISFGERCNLINMITMHGAKKIITVHSQLSIENKAKGFYGTVSTLLGRLLYKKADSIIAVSEIVKKDFVNLLNVNPSKVDVIYNGHDLKNIEYKSEIKTDIPKCIDFVSVGRITYAKGHFHLLRCISLVKKIYPNVHLVIVGGYEKDNLKNLLDAVIKKYDLFDNVTFIGFTDNPYPYIKNAKALVLSSIFEGFPGVVIESLSLGTPVIATDCGGATEVLMPYGKATNGESSIITEYGILTPKLDGDYDINSPLSSAETILAESMCSIFKNNNFERENLINKASSYNIDSMIEKYVEHIEKVYK